MCSFKPVVGKAEKNKNNQNFKTIIFSIIKCWFFMKYLDFIMPWLICVLPADRPTPPIGPVVFDEVHREYMVISWKPPLDSGGVDISNYIVEKRDTNRDMWTTVTSATTKTMCKVGLSST